MLAKLQKSAYRLPGYNFTQICINKLPKKESLKIQTFSMRQYKNKSCVSMKLFPQRTEELFETLPDVNRCGVIALEDKTRLHIAIAFVTKKQDSGCSEESLIANLYKLSNDTLPIHQTDMRLAAASNHHVLFPCTSLQSLNILAHKGFNISFIIFD